MKSVFIEKNYNLFETILINLGFKHKREYVEVKILDFKFIDYNTMLIKFSIKNRRGGVFIKGSFRNYIRNNETKLFSDSYLINFEEIVRTNKQKFLKC